ncbi:MAG: VWA domain-containing protein [Candidatus Sulfotelmatobacter sp.]
MNRTKRLAAALSACLALSAWPRASAQGAGGGDQRVTLYVVVTDKSGNPVAGLQHQDFTVLDNKRQQPISSFRAIDESGKTEDSPVRVIFVMDEVNVSFRAMSNARQQLERYLRQAGGQLPLPMSLVIFNEKSTQVQGTPTRNGNVLADSVHAIIAGAPRELEGGLLENQVWRIRISLRAVGNLIGYERTQPGRKLLIWLSPGWPLIEESIDNLTSKAKQTNFQTLVKLSTALRQAQITLYSIDPLGTDDAGSLGNVYYQNFLHGVPSADRFQSGDLTIPVLAIQSGGQVLNRSNDVASLISNCVADAMSYYSLTFDSSPVVHPDEYHDLRVKIDKPGVVARTRTGYYAQP